MEFPQKRGSISNRHLSFGANILQIKSQVPNRIANSFEKHVLNCNLVSLKEARNPFFFRLFPIISISQKFFSIFFLTLEKIGIDNGILLP